MIGVTADSNIYVSGLQFGGVPLQFLNAARAGFLRLDVSIVLLEEVRGVLRDKFKWPEPTLDEAMARLARLTSVVTPKLTLDVVDSDPDDNRVLECAVEAGSRFIVTGDTDLLRLGQYQGIRIVRGAEFMEMMQWPAV